MTTDPIVDVMRAAEGGLHHFRWQALAVRDYVTAYLGGDLEGHADQRDVVEHMFGVLGECSGVAMAAMHGFLAMFGLPTKANDVNENSLLQEERRTPSRSC